MSGWIPFRIDIDGLVNNSEENLNQESPFAPSDDEGVEIDALVGV